MQLDFLMSRTQKSYMHITNLYSHLEILHSFYIRVIADIKFEFISSFSYQIRFDEDGSFSSGLKASGH